MKTNQSFIQKGVLILSFIFLIGIAFLWGIPQKKMPVNNELKKRILYSYMKKEFEFMPKNIAEMSKEYIVTIYAHPTNKSDELQGKISKFNDRNRLSKVEDFEINKNNKVINFDGTSTKLLSEDTECKKIRNNFSIPDETLITSSKERFKVFIEDTVHTVPETSLINVSENADNIPQEFKDKGPVFSAVLGTLTIANNGNNIYTLTKSLSANADGSPTQKEPWKKSEDINAERISYFNKNKKIKDSSEHILKKILKNHSEMNQEIKTWLDVSDLQSTFDYKFTSTIEGYSTGIGVKGTTVYLFDTDMDEDSYRPASFSDTQKLTQDYTSQLWEK